jgi:hypothetical protein
LLLVVILGTIKVNPDSDFINVFCFYASDFHIMMGNATSAAWTASPVDECLDKLGTCEATVSECETRNFILEAQMAVLRHPKVVIGLACGVAVLLLLGLLRCCSHVRAGAVQGVWGLIFLYEV